MSEQDKCGLAAEDYRDAAMALLPEGPAWPRDAESLPPNFWLAIGYTFARIHQRACDLARESLACYALETLDDWERVYALPDACDPNADRLTIAERKLTLCARETTLGGQSKAYFIAVAEALGYEITVTRVHEAICGLSYCGTDNVCGPEGISLIWTVHVPGPRVTWAECGLAEGGDYMATIATADDLECRLNALAPAHGKLLFSYEG